MDDSFNSSAFLPKHLRYINFVMACMELKLFESTRFFFFKNEEHSFGISVILITFFISSLKIFDIIPFVSFIPMEGDKEYTIFVTLLCTIGICFVLWYFGDYFLALSVFMSHILFVFFFSKLLVFPMIYSYERTYFLQMLLGYLWWLAFSYLCRYNILYIYREKSSFVAFLIFVIGVLYWGFVELI